MVVKSSGGRETTAKQSIGDTEGVQYELSLESPGNAQLENAIQPTHKSLSYAESGTFYPFDKHALAYPSSHSSVDRH